MGRALRRRLFREMLRKPWTTGPVTARRLLVLALFTPPFLLLQAIHWLCFRLDELCYPRYRDIAIRAPLFITGMPRSGTTFLHNVLARDTANFTTPRLWELVLAPSIVQRKLVYGLARVDRLFGSPGGRLIGLLEKVLFRSLSDVHAVTFNSPEEDYLGLLPAFACFILVVPFPDHPAVWDLARFDEMPDGERREIMRFYHGQIQRHLYIHGADRVYLSKNPSFASMVGSLDEEFPDCRILFHLRNPEKAVPSLLSSLRQGSLPLGYDISSPPWAARFVEMLVRQTEAAIARIPAMPSHRADFVVMERLVGDVESFVAALYGQFGLEITPGFARVLRDEGERSRAYRSSHSYTGSEQPGRVLRKQFDHLHERFEFGVPDQAAAS